MPTLGDDGFDSEEEDSSMEPLPAGRYDLIATESSLEDNSKGTGKLLKFTYEVTSENGKGRRVWESFNFVHQNETAQQIGRQNFAKLCKACGVSKPKESEELHNIPFAADLEIIQNDGYAARNVVKKYIEKKSAPKKKASGAKKTSSKKTDSAPPWAGAA